MRRVAITLISGFVLLACGAAVAAEKARIVPNGETRLGARSAKLGVEISIKTRPAGEATHLPDAGSSMVPQKSFVEGLTIAVNGNPVFVPLSVLCDLFNPNWAEVRLGSTVTVLTITGSDASEAYVAKIEFDSKRVRRLSVFSGMVPEKPLQVTTYHEVTVRDDPAP